MGLIVADYSGLLRGAWKAGLTGSLNFEIEETVGIGGR
jgi:hypothetical protein